MKLRSESIIFQSRHCQRKERAFFWVRQLTDRNHPSKHKQHTKHRQHTRLVRTEGKIMFDVTRMEVKSKEQFSLAQAEDYFWYFPLKQKDTLKKFIRYCTAHFSWHNSLLDAVNNCKENYMLESQHWQKSAGKKNPQLSGHVAGQASRLQLCYCPNAHHYKPITESKLHFFESSYQEVMCIMPGSEVSLSGWCSSRWSQSKKGNQFESTTPHGPPFPL